jgi:hypothetical protein
MTSVSSLSPTFARPGRLPEVEVRLDQLAQAEMRGERGRQEEPGVGHQAIVVEGRIEPVEAVRRSHLSGVLPFGSVVAQQPHRPSSEGHLFACPDRRIGPGYRWIRGKAQGDLTPDIFVLIIALQTGIIGAALYGLTFAAMILWAARGPTQGRALVLAMLGIFVTSSVLSSSPDAPIFATTIWILIVAVSAIPTETARSRPVSDHPRAG